MTVVYVLSWGFLFFTIGWFVGRDSGHQQAMAFRDRLDKRR